MQTYQIYNAAGQPVGIQTMEDSMAPMLLQGWHCVVISGDTTNSEGVSSHLNGPLIDAQPDAPHQ